MDVKITVSFDPKFGSISNKKIDDWILETLRLTKGHAFQMLNSGGRSGKKYPGLPNQSSAPGEPPRTQSGKLAGSMTEPVASGLEGRFGETAYHAQFLENGSPGGKIKPRPHLRPSLDWALRENPVPADIIVWGAR